MKKIIALLLFIFIFTMVSFADEVVYEHKDYRIRTPVSIENSELFKNYTEFKIANEDYPFYILNLNGNTYYRLYIEEATDKGNIYGFIPCEINIVGGTLEIVYNINDKLLGVDE